MMETCVKNYTHLLRIRSSAVKIGDGMHKIHSLIFRIDVRMVKISC